MQIPPRWHVPVRYTLFQMPGIAFVGLGLYAAVHLWSLEPAWAWAALALWVAKDAAMFPLVRSAYEPGGRGAEALVGSHGVAEGPIAPDGWVRIGPELWRARLAPRSEPARRGAPVRVVRVHGLVLLVEPEAGGADPPRPGAA